MLTQMIFSRLSLRLVITTVFAILLTVLAGLTWFLTFHNSQLYIRDLADQIGRQSMLNIRRDLEDYISAPRIVNEINASSFEEQNPKASNQLTMIREFIAEVKAHPSTISVAYANKYGEYLGVTRGVIGVPLSLGICDQTTSHFLEAYRIDETGRRQDRVARSETPFDPRLRPWYTAAEASAVTTWTPIYLWVTGDAGLDAVTPIRDRAGTLLGVLDTSLTLSGIGSFLQSVRATAHSEAFILEKSGALVAASSIVKPYRLSGNQLQRETVEEIEDPDIRTSAQEVIRAFAASDHGDGERKIAFIVGGVRRELRFAPFRNGNGLDWLIAEVIPESDFAQSIYQDMRSTVVFVVLFLLFSMGVALLLARQIGRPLRLLSEMARNFAKGRFDHPILAGGTNEVGQLTASFNIMSEELRASFGSLAASEVRYRTLFEGMPVGLFRTDGSGGIEQANSRLRAMFGFSDRDSLSEVNAFSLLNNPEDRQRLRDAVGKDGQIQDTDVQMVRDDGGTFWARVHVRVLRDSPDGQIHYEGSMVDVTERKRLEEQLRQSQKMEAIGQLAGGVAHDFNNVLADTMMNLDLLEENPHLDREAHEVVKELKADAERAASLTRQLLIFGRRSLLDIRVLNLNDVVANSLKILSRLLGEHVTLVFEQKGSLPTVEADAGMLELVLLNLAVNARDAMPRGGRITLATETVEIDPERAAAIAHRRTGQFVCLSVSDTGCGMEESTLRQIFEPFFTTKAVGKGTGLGLSTVHGIVAQHRGWIEAESHVGEGTIFRIYLPASDKAAVNKAAAESTVIPKGRETILLVEDDASVRRLVAKASRALGYQVLEASNGQEAITLWRDHSRRIDLLLTDMVMPEGMTGLELAQRVRKEKPDLKIIVSSGYSAEVNQSGKPTAEGIVYLPKPFKMSALGTILRECLDAK